MNPTVANLWAVLILVVVSILMMPVVAMALGLSVKLFRHFAGV